MDDNYETIESILAIDCGSTLTQASLFDLVEGEHRFISRGLAPSTVEPPWTDMTAAVRHAVGELSEVTGRTVFGSRGQLLSPERPEGGVDVMVATTSASAPLRLVLAGIAGDLSLTSAYRALSTTYALVEGTISLDQRSGGVQQSDIQAQVNLIHDLKPDAILMVGGVDGGAEAPVLKTARAVALACSTMRGGVHPQVIYAGNAHIRSQVAEIVGGEAELRAVANVRPDLQTENLGPLQAEIEELFRTRKMERLPGFGTLTEWTPASVLTTARAFSNTVRYLAQVDQINVLGVDVGGTTTTLASVLDGHVDLLTQSDLGLSYHVANVLDSVSLESIARWLPFEMELGDVHNALLNKSLRYRTMPQTPQDLFLEQAVAREVLRLVTADALQRWPASQATPDLLPKFHLILASGGLLANVPHVGQAVLILLDALQPVGVCELGLDRTKIAPAVGAMAMVNPLAAAQVMERDVILNLGTVVAPLGTAKDGDVALNVKVEHDDGRSLQVEVPYGSLEILPLPKGETASLELRPTRRFDVGLGTRGKAATTQVRGGAVGIIIDARGRPLSLADDLAERQQNTQRWLRDMGA
jgi:hypothetical protein